MTHKTELTKDRANALRDDLRSDGRQWDAQTVQDLLMALAAAQRVASQYAKEKA